MTETERIRCAWCETELAPEDGKPIKYARLTDRPGAENVQCKDGEACRQRQDRLDDAQRARMEAAGLGSLFGLPGIRPLGGEGIRT